jgi:hypothetical protein
MSEMGEMESLRLQMAMDRLSRLMSTLSNPSEEAERNRQQRHAESDVTARTSARLPNHF